MQTNVGTGTRPWPVLLFLAFLLSAGEAAGLSHTPQTPATIARQAAIVVIATVDAAQRTTTAEGAEIEWLTLKVHERWRGPAVSALRVRQLLTARDAKTGRRVAIAGNFALETGRTYLLFLPPEVELPQVPMTVAGESGAYEATRRGASWEFRTLAGQRVLDVRSDGWHVEPVPQAGHVVGRLQSSPEPAAQEPGGRLQSNVPGRPKVMPAPAPAGDIAARWRQIVLQAGAP